MTAQLETRESIYKWLSKYYRKGSHSLFDYEEVKKVYQDHPQYCEIINWTVSWLAI